MSIVLNPEQIAIDTRWLPLEFWATRAHVVMLAETGTVPRAAARKLLEAIAGLEKDAASGAWRLSPELGAHFSIERALAERAGEEAAGWLHTARSRNDQAATLQRMFSRELCLSSVKALEDLVLANLNLARAHHDTVLPGYTHMQPAKATTVAAWAGAFAATYLRDIDRIKEVHARLDLCPLGAAESYGTRFPIDRKRTAELLGFSKVQEFALDAVTSRGEFETDLTAAFAQAGVHLSRQAQDLMLWSTEEFGYVDWKNLQWGDPANGSSIMAQKKNPDAMELVRAGAARLAAAHAEMLHLLSGLPSGYQRDSRETRRALIEAGDRFLAVAEAMSKDLGRVGFRVERMRAAVLRNYSLAPELTDLVSQQLGVPFRASYKFVGALVEELRAKGAGLDALTGDDLGGRLRAAGYEANGELPAILMFNDPDAAVAARNPDDGAYGRLKSGLAAAGAWRVAEGLRLKERRDAALAAAGTVR